MFKGGKKEAAKMLNLLGSSEAKSLLEKIRQKDPILAGELEEMLVSMEDLQYLTDNMKMNLLRDLDLKVLGHAMRTLDKDVQSKILKNLSSGILLDIDEGLKGPPIPLSQVDKAQSIVLKTLKEKIDRGQIVIRSNEDFV